MSISAILFEMSVSNTHEEIFDRHKELFKSAGVVLLTTSGESSVVLRHDSPLADSLLKALGKNTTTILMCTNDGIDYYVLSNWDAEDAWNNGYTSYENWINHLAEVISKVNNNSNPDDTSVV